MSYIELENDDIEIVIGGKKFNAFISCDVEVNVIEGWKGDWHNPPEPDEVEVINCAATITIDMTNGDQVCCNIDHWELFHLFWSPDDDEVRDKALEAAANARHDYE